jgi:DNA-directed RNA polymerase specialized sigma24 family protein
MSNPSPDAPSPDPSVPGPASASPILSDEAFARFFRESFEVTIAWTLSHLSYIARDRTTAEQIAGDAYDATYLRRHEVRTNAVAFLHDRILESAKAYKRRHGMTVLENPSIQAPLDPAGRSPESILASQECREIFSQEAVASLDPGQRRMYDLYLEGKKYRQIAQTLGLTLDQVKSAFKIMFRQLCEIMSRHVTLDGPDIPRGHHVSLRTRKSALAAIATLPVLLRQVATLTYVEQLPPARTVIRLNLASPEELEVHLGRAHEVLEILFREKMPEALVRALAYTYPGTAPEEVARV